VKPSLKKLSPETQSWGGQKPRTGGLRARSHARMASKELTSWKNFNDEKEDFCAATLRKRQKIKGEEPNGAGNVRESPCVPRFHGARGAFGDHDKLYHIQQGKVF